MISASRTFDHWPARAELVAALATPLVGLARLRFAEVGGRVEARWSVPWLHVALTFVLAFGSLSGGLVVASHFDRLGATAMWCLLAAIWLVLVPVAVFVFRASIGHALRQPVLLELDPDAETVEVAGPKVERYAIPKDRIRAFVTVTRMVRAGAASGEDAGGGRFVTRTEYSLLHEPEGDRFQQIPLFAIQDSGKREEELRRWMHELPRRLECKRIGVALDRRGELRERRDVR